jgi:guanylate kinase
LASNKDFIGIFIDIDDEQLINRLKKRGHDNAFVDERMRLAEYQRNFIDKFQYKINNKDINTTVNEILDIIYILEEK